MDPPPPIESAGVSVISTKEFYEASKARLVPGGVMMQWVPYGQTLDEFLAHVRSLLAVFPNVNVIAGAGGYGFYMLGSDGNVDLAPDGDRGRPRPARRPRRRQLRAGRRAAADGGPVGRACSWASSGRAATRSARPWATAR